MSTNGSPVCRLGSRSMEQWVEIDLSNCEYENVVQFSFATSTTLSIMYLLKNYTHASIHMLTLYEYKHSILTLIILSPQGGKRIARSMGNNSRTEPCNCNISPHLHRDRPPVAISTAVILLLPPPIQRRIGFHFKQQYCEKIRER